MGHMGLDQVAGGKGTAERQLAGQDTSSDNAGKTPGVLTRVGRMRTADAEHVEHGRLGLEDGATAKGTDFNGRHRDGDLEVSTEAINRVSCALSSLIEGMDTHFLMRVMQLALSTTWAGS